MYFSCFIVVIVFNPCCCLKVNSPNKEQFTVSHLFSDAPTFLMRDTPMPPTDTWRLNRLKPIEWSFYLIATCLWQNGLLRTSVMSMRTSNTCCDLYGTHVLLLYLSNCAYNLNHLKPFTQNFTLIFNYNKFC